MPFGIQGAIIDVTENSILPAGGSGSNPAYQEMKRTKEQLANNIVIKSNSVIMTIGNRC